jgi:quinol monooxygenase YgiN
MAVRLVVTFHAASGKGAELAQAMKARCEVSRQDAGCEQFEVFQSVSDPDKLVLLELWKDQAALDAHAKCASPGLARQIARRDPPRDSFVRCYPLALAQDQSGGEALVV